MRHGTEHCALIDGIAAAQAGACHNADVGIDDAVVTYFHIALNIGEGIYRDVVAYLGRRVNKCLWTDVTHDWFLLGLFLSASECVVEIYHGLHAVEVVADFRQLGLQQ